MSMAKGRCRAWGRLFRVTFVLWSVIPVFQIWSMQCSRLPAMVLSWKYSSAPMCHALPHFWTQILLCVLYSVAGLCTIISVIPDQLSLAYPGSETGECNRVTSSAWQVFWCWVVFSEQHERKLCCVTTGVVDVFQMKPWIKSEIVPVWTRLLCFRFWTKIENRSFGLFLQGRMVTLSHLLERKI